MLTRLSGLLAAVAAVATLSAAAPAAAAPARAPLPQTIQAWGSNAYGELGNGTTTDSSLPGPVKIPAHTQFTSARCLLSCLAVTTTGQVYAWGNNTEGQLGDGTTKQRLTPVRVHLPAGTKVTAVRPGAYYTLALTASGKVLAWGSNADGQLGTGSTKSSRLPVPVKLPTGVTVKAISAGEDNGLALTATGQVLSWGANASGQLGTGTTKGRLTPGRVSLPKGTTVASIAAGPLSGYAVTKGGGMLAWGLNNHGQLGDGTTRQRDKAVRVALPKGTTVVAAVSGDLHVLALTKGGKVLAWGTNQVGQLGIGTTTERHRPVFVSLPTGTKVSALAAGKDYSLALTDEGVQPGPSRAAGRLPVVHGILAWGGNEAGQLGTGTTASSLVPVPPKLTDLLQPTSIGSGWGSVTSVTVCNQTPV
jgi:alpha-tubulin suppressor-like RCC1 family protein